MVCVRACVCVCVCVYQGIIHQDGDEDGTSAAGEQGEIQDNVQDWHDDTKKKGTVRSVCLHCVHVLPLFVCLSSPRSGDTHF